MTNPSLPKAPWLRFSGDVPARLDYFEGTMWDGVRKAAETYPAFTAFDFMGKSTSYAQLAADVNRCANALREVGVRPSDRVLICLPNCPQAVVLFYAVNAVGAVSVMVHPLSGEKEIEFYLKDAGCRVAVTLDQFYGKFAAVRENTSLDLLIVSSVADALPPLAAVGYRLTEGRKLPKIPETTDTFFWFSFLRNGCANFLDIALMHISKGLQKLLFFHNTIPSCSKWIFSLLRVLCKVTFTLLSLIPMALAISRTGSIAQYRLRKIFRDSAESSARNAFS